MEEQWQDCGFGDFFLRADHWRGTNFVRVLLQQLMILVNHSHKNGFSEIDDQIEF